MIAELHDGRRLHCEDQPMGGGASGTTFYSQDREHVIKIFKNPSPDMQRALVEVLGTYNCVGEDPYWRQFMSWPDGLVTKPSLGVCMPCAPQGMDKMTWIIYPKLYNRLPVTKKLWDKRLVIAIRLAAAVARMHRSGVAHSDLSPNNIMVDPSNGGVNLIDLDGLVVPGFLPPQVLGTPEYIAPEVLAAKAWPSVSTDRHALAVILYQLLLFRHPFRGPKVYSHDSEEDEKMALGEDGVFIDHPHNKSNRPKKKFWPTVILGNLIEDLFERAFVLGTKDPSRRPTASEWQMGLARVSDRIVGCANPRCEEKYFPAADGRRLSCPWCESPFLVREGLPVLRLYIGDRSGQFQIENDYWIAGYPGKTLHVWHAETGVEPGPDVDAEPVARIVLEQGKWFLVNLSLNYARLIEGGTLGKPIPVGHKVELTEGLALMLGPIHKGRMAYVQWLR